MAASKSCSIEFSSDDEGGASVIKMPRADEPPSPIHAESARFYHMSYNGQFQEAAAELEPIWEETPRLAIAYCMALSWRSQMTGAEEDRVVTKEASSKAMDICSKILKKKARLQALLDRIPQEERGDWTDEELLENLRIDTEVVGAESRLWYALGLLMTGAYIKGPYHLRGAWKKFQSINSEIESSDIRIMDSVRGGATFGVGCFLYFMSFIPDGIGKKFLKLIGFQADSDEGVRCLRQTYESGSTNAASAAIFIVATKVFFPKGFKAGDEEFAEAEELNSAVLARYPNGSLFQMIESHLARKQADATRAVAAANAMVESAQASGVDMPANFLAEQAWCYAYDFQWERTLEILTQLLDERDEFDYRQLCMLTKAGAIAMGGNFDGALTYLTEAFENVEESKHMWDKFAKPHANNCIELGNCHLLSYEILFLRRELHRMAPERWEAALLHIEKVADRDSPDLAIIYHMLRIPILRGLGREDDALAACEQALELASDVSVNVYAIPHVHYEMAHMRYNEGDLDGALVQLGAAEGYSDFLWSSMLLKRVSRAKKQVEQDQKDAA